MDLPIILLGIVIGAIVAFNGVKRDQQKTAQAKVRPSDAPRVFYTPLPLPPRRNPQGLPLPPQTGDPGVASRAWVETWRRSIVGLIRLAQRNLAQARQRLELGDYQLAIEVALTGVENMSRALLHCYGEKPDLNAGQEEALRLLSRRFAGDEKIAFEKAIEEIVQLHRDKVAHGTLSIHNLSFPVVLTETRVTQVLDSAFQIVTLFAHTIHDHFGTEIPELLEVCPKCHAMNISVWAFSRGTAYCTCNLCGHKWRQSETP